MTIDLKAMSRKELVKLRTDIDKALKDAELREKAEALKAAERAAADFGYSLDELRDMSSKRKSGASASKSPAKYRNPANPDETWSGRGRKPDWFHEAMASGVDISTLEI